MKKIIQSVIITAILSSCNAFNPTATKKATSYDIIERCELTDSTHLLIIKTNNKNYRTVFITQNDYKELKRLKKFLIEYTCPDNEYGVITSIKPLKDFDTSAVERELFKAEAKDIEDYKRRNRGSYTIIELQDKEGMIVVKTPSQEISNMLRIEDFKFYYYKDWEGNYCFDHIETD